MPQMPVSTAAASVTQVHGISVASQQQMTPGIGMNIQRQQIPQTNLTQQPLPPQGFPQGLQRLQGPQQQLLSQGQDPVLRPPQISVNQQMIRSPIGLQQQQQQPLPQQQLPFEQQQQHSTQQQIQQQHMQSNRSSRTQFQDIPQNIHPELPVSQDFYSGPQSRLQENKQQHMRDDFSQKQHPHQHPSSSQQNVRHPHPTQQGHISQQQHPYQPQNNQQQHLQGHQMGGQQTQHPGQHHQHPSQQHSMHHHQPQGSQYQSRQQPNLMPQGNRRTSSPPQDYWSETDLSPIQDVSPSIEAAEQKSMESIKRSTHFPQQEVSKSILSLSL